jgi:hypothetical protein
VNPSSDVRPRLIGDSCVVYKAGGASECEPNIIFLAGWLNRQTAKYQPT